MVSQLIQQKNELLNANIYVDYENIFELLKKYGVNPIEIGFFPVILEKMRNEYKLNIVDPEYEWVIARYIEVNPVRANMVNNAEDYKFSSARMHLLGEKNEIVGKDIIGDRLQEYREFINEKKGNGSKQLDQMRAVIKQEKVFGSEEFIESIEERFKTFFRIRGRGRPAKIKSHPVY